MSTANIKVYIGIGPIVSLRKNKLDRENIKRKSFIKVWVKIESFNDNRKRKMFGPLLA